MEQPRLLTITQVGNEYQIKRDKLRALLRAGHIDSIVLGTNKVLIPRESIESFVTRAANGEIPEAAPVWMSHRSTKAASSPASTRS